LKPIHRPSTRREKSVRGKHSDVRKLPGKPKSWARGLLGGVECASMATGMTASASKHLHGIVPILGDVVAIENRGFAFVDFYLTARDRTHFQIEPMRRSQGRAHSDLEGSDSIGSKMRH